MKTVQDVGKIDVAYVANLARIELTAEETAAFQNQLDHVVAYFRDLSEVDVSNVEPMAHAIQVQNVFRADTVGASLPRERMLANSPMNDGEQILVPQIV